MNDILSRVARDFGTPCFVYFMDQVRERVQAVRSAFGDRLRISYAVKSNPNPGILRRMRDLVDSLDVSSAGEVRGAVESGWEAKLVDTSSAKPACFSRASFERSTRVARTCMCDGGMKHHLAAAGHLGAVVQRNYQMFKVSGAHDDGPEKPYNLVGPLCTTIDTLGRQVKFRGLEAGDVIGLKCSGAYGLTASPLHFISHPPAKEIIVETQQGRLLVDDSSQFPTAAGLWRDDQVRDGAASN